MLFFALPLLFLIFYLCVQFLLVWLICVFWLICISLINMWSILPQRSLRHSSIIFIIFLSWSSTVIYLILSCNLSILLPQFCYWFLVYYFVISIPVCLFFISSRCLLNVLNISYIFSILFSIFWNFVTIIALNSYSDRLPISSSFIWPFSFLPCSFICNIFCCCFSFFVFF